MKFIIPRRIIQTRQSFDLPLLLKAAVANVRLLNPDFEYLFFDDKQVEEFVSENFPEYRSVFHSFRVPIQRFDFFRYLAVYHFGGFYLDTDIFLASGMDDLLDFGCVFPFEELTISMFLRREYGMDWEIGNYAFGAAAGHPFIQAIIENCVRAQTDPRWARVMMKPIPRMFREDFYVLNTTGPGLISRTLAEYPAAAKQVKVLFPENVCDSTTWYRFGSYGVHFMEGSWLKKKNILRRSMISFWDIWKRKKYLNESRKIGRGRSLEMIRKKNG